MYNKIYNLPKCEVHSFISFNAKIVQPNVVSSNAINEVSVKNNVLSVRVHLRINVQDEECSNWLSVMTDRLKVRIEANIQEDKH